MQFIIKSPLNRAGVYRIKNNIDKSLYIGRSKHLRERAEEHKRNFATMRCNKKIRAFIKANPQVIFTFEVLRYCPNIKEAEERFIKYFDSVRFGFNLVYNDEEIKKRLLLSLAKRRETRDKQRKEARPKAKTIKEPCIKLKWLYKTKAYKLAQANT